MAKKKAKVNCTVLDRPGGKPMSVETEGKYCNVTIVAYHTPRVLEGRKKDGWEILYKVSVKGGYFRLIPKKIGVNQLRLKAGRKIIQTERI